MGDTRTPPDHGRSHLARNGLFQARADNAAVLLDNEDYFRAAGEAILQARHSVMLLGWCFDPHAPLFPSDGRRLESCIGAELNAAVRRQPALEVYIVCWDMPLALALPRGLFPQRARRWFTHERCRFILDRAPGGACHHQKVLVIDDSLAFCSGGDFLPNRWDSSAHLDQDPRRTSSPRHSTTILLAGPAASLLGDLARDRVEGATGERPRKPAPPERPLWPASVPADCGPATVGIARTYPGTGGRPAIRENLHLWLSSIAAARELIYLENQYLASPVIRQALAERLGEEDGPEVVVICSPREPSWFDGIFMGSAKRLFVRALRDSDRHDRLRVYAPLTQEGKIMLNHSKLTIIDDRLLRVGSANINNRSLGLDSECDAVIEVDAAAGSGSVREFIRRTCCRSIGHFLYCAPSRFADEWERCGSVIAAVEAIDPTGARLSPMQVTPPRGLRRLVAEYEIGDPYGPEDVMKPWLRRRKRRAVLQQDGRGEPSRADRSRKRTRRS